MEAEVEVEVTVPQQFGAVDLPGLAIQTQTTSGPSFIV